MATITVPATKLIEDFDLYPRHVVDSSHVSNLVRAIEAGADLPVPLVDQKFRIIDGFHRVRAHVRTGAEKIRVQQKTYKSDADALRDAVSLNAQHGRKLDERDRTRSILLLEQAGVDTKDIAVTLHTTEERVRKLSLRVVQVDDHRQPAKKTWWPKDGEAPKKMSAAQYRVASSSSAWSVLQTVRQLRREIKADLVPLDREEVVIELEGLRDDLAAVL